MYIFYFMVFSIMVYCKTLNRVPYARQEEGCGLSLLFTAVCREGLFMEHSDCCIWAQNLLYYGLCHLILPALAEPTACFSAPGSTQRTQCGLCLVV